MHCKNMTPFSVDATVAMQMKNENAFRNPTSFGTTMSVNAGVGNTQKRVALLVSSLTQTLARKYFTKWAQLSLLFCEYLWWFFFQLCCPTGFKKTPRQYRYLQVRNKKASLAKQNIQCVYPPIT